MKPAEFPSFIYQLGSYPAYYDLLVNQYANVDKADWIFCNTFDELEREVIISLLLKSVKSSSNFGVVISL